MKTNQNQTPLTDRQKVNLFLDHINEHDTACRQEVIQNCKNDKSARAYYVKRYTSDCACATS